VRIDVRRLTEARERHMAMRLYFQNAVMITE